MPPSKALGHILLALEALHELDDMEVWHINLRVLLQVEVLLSLKDTLCKKPAGKQGHA